MSTTWSGATCSWTRTSLVRAVAPMALCLLAPLRAVPAAGSRPGPSFDGGDCAIRLCAWTLLTMREGTRTSARDRTCTRIRTRIRTPHHTWAAKRKGGAPGAEGDKAVGDDEDGAANVRDGVRVLGKLLLTASADTTAKVWDVDSRELVAGRASTSTHTRTHIHARLIADCASSSPARRFASPPKPGMMMPRVTD